MGMALSKTPRNDRHSTFQTALFLAILFYNLFIYFLIFSAAAYSSRCAYAGSSAFSNAAKSTSNSRSCRSFSSSAIWAASCSCTTFSEIIARVLAFLFHNLLLFGRQFLPGLFADHVHHRVIGMFSQEGISGFRRVYSDRSPKSGSLSSTTPCFIAIYNSLNAIEVTTEPHASNVA